jgi:hypothetical protein
MSVMDLPAFPVIPAVLLIVYAWRAVRRTRGSWSGPLPDIGEAPPDAEPIVRPRLNDDGLVTFSLDLTPGRMAPVPPRRPSTRRP